MIRLWMLLFLLLAPVSALLPMPALAVDDPAEMLSNPAQEARAETIGAQLRCLVCQNESIEDSGADLARDLRRIVRVHVKDGESNQQIIGWMVERYGNFIRLRPPFNGMTMLLWIMPLLALALGGAASWLGWRRRRHQAPPQPLSDIERRRLDDLIESR
jgi:cytochrome c-type biogenesis protein CcmH